jgi:CRP-like cAMP-binding protein
MTQKRTGDQHSGRADENPRSMAFSEFPPESAAALRAAAVHRCWSNGSVVLEKDRVVPWVLAIVRGRLRIAASSEEGHMVFFRWQLPGETVGLASAVSGLPLPVEIKAFDDCETLHVDRELFLGLMHGDAATACAAARHVAAHAYDLIHHLTVSGQ